MLSIRPANSGDVSVLKTMIHEFAAFERLPVVVTDASLLRDGFSERPRFRVLMAEWDGQPAGYAFFFDYTQHSRGVPEFSSKIFIFGSGRETTLEKHCSPAWPRLR